MKAIFCLVKTEAQAQSLVDKLMSAGFSNEDISVLFPERARQTGVKGTTTPRRDGVTTEKHTKAPEGGVVGATTGGVIGGSIGLLAGLGALAIPGLGPFIAAGPILAALSGSAVGGSLGLLIGSLIGAGIPEYEAKKYEAGLKAGNILVSVHSESTEELNRANEIMRKEGATDISTSREKTTTREY